MAGESSKLKRKNNTSYEIEKNDFLHKKDVSLIIIHLSFNRTPKVHYLQHGLNIIHFFTQKFCDNKWSHYLFTVSISNFDIN